MTSEILDTKKFTLVQLAILATCLVCKMLEGFANAIIAYTAPAISRDWQASPEELGMVFSAGLAGMTIGAMFISSYADTYGRRFVAMAAMLLMGAATLAVFFINSVETLVAARILSGIGIGTLMAVLTTLGGEYSPQSSRNFVLAALVSASALGSVVGGIIASAWLPVHGWRSLYLYSGAITLVFAGVFFVVVPESLSHLVRKNSSVSLDRINSILKHIGQKQIHALPQEDHQLAEPATVKSLLTQSRRTLTLIAWATFFSAFAGMYFIITWLPKLLVDSGIPEAESIQAVVVLTFGSMVGALVIGWISRWWELRYLIALSYGVAAMLILVFSIFLSGATSIPVKLSWFLSFLIGVTLLGGFSNMYSLALSMYPSSIKITGLGWCIGLGRGGAILSPIVAGLLLGAGITSPEVLAWSAITAVLAMAGILLVKPRLGD